MNETVATPLRAGRQEREQLIGAYEQYLLARDGVLGTDGTTFDRREQTMHALGQQTVRYRGPVDEVAFRQGYEQRDPHPDTDQEMLLLLAYLKINAQEAFAVETIQRGKRKMTSLDTRVLIQENYHTRLLMGAAPLFGLAEPGPQRPLFLLRVVVTAIAKTPPAVMHTLALASEIIGVATFLRLLRVTRTTMRAHPELRDALEERLMQVCTDEVGHLSFNRLKVGRMGMAIVGALLPVLVAGFRNALPELDRMCGGPLSLAEVASLRWTDLPEAARRTAFIA